MTVPLFCGAVWGADRPTAPKRLLRSWLSYSPGCPLYLELAPVICGSPCSRKGAPLTQAGVPRTLCDCFCVSYSRRGRSPTQRVMALRLSVRTLGKHSFQCGWTLVFLATTHYWDSMVEITINILSYAGALPGWLPLGSWDLTMKSSSPGPSGLGWNPCSAVPWVTLWLSLCLNLLLVWELNESLCVKYLEQFLSSTMYQLHINYQVLILSFLQWLRTWHCPRPGLSETPDLPPPAPPVQPGSDSPSWLPSTLPLPDPRPLSQFPVWTPTHIPTQIPAGADRPLYLGGTTRSGWKAPSAFLT